MFENSHFGIAMWRMQFLNYLQMLRESNTSVCIMNIFFVLVTF